MAAVGDSQIHVTFVLMQIFYSLIYNAFPQRNMPPGARAVGQEVYCSLETVSQARQGLH
jgi:hypothetical protein